MHGVDGRYLIQTLEGASAGACSRRRGMRVEWEGIPWGGNAHINAWGVEMHLYGGN
jgi:hypothetical protein